MSDNMLGGIIATGILGIIIFTIVDDFRLYLMSKKNGEPIPIVWLLMKGGQYLIDDLSRDPRFEHYDKMRRPILESRKRQVVANLLCLLVCVLLIIIREFVL